MLEPGFVLLASFAYLGLLFAIAYVAERRAAAGRSVIANSVVYALSLAVYATSWTYYGSVGRAATSGADFLTIYLGPTLMFALGWLVLRKIIRISKANRMTSIADFVASRYGKSTLLGGLVTVIAVVGIVPYIALQLKAISNTLSILPHYPQVISAAALEPVSLLEDEALYVALALAAFTILFGTRKLDVTERHEGMVAAIAFESLVKLVAFTAIGLFVTFGVFGGFADVFDRAAALPEGRGLVTLGGEGGVGYGTWAWLTVLSMLAVVLLPRQFQVMVVENVDERHLTRAIWLFPLYLLAINVFVLPIALGGLVRFGDSVDADTFVLTLPMAEGQPALALLAYLGGLSAATGMVIVEAIALSTMISNHLVVPVLLRTRGSGLPLRSDVRRLVLGIRRAAIVILLLLGYAYFRAAGEGIALVSIGLMSFAAVAQFAPAILGGMFWKGASRDGALAGLVAGFAVWAYTLLLPSLARSGWLAESFLAEGPFGIEFLRPTQLFGLGGLDETSHAMFWSMLLNAGLFVAVSVLGRRSAAERAQAALFVDVFRPVREGRRLWRGSASVADLQALLARFLGPDRAAAVVAAHARAHGVEWREARADAELVDHVERVLAGSIGAASARVMVAAVVDEEPLGLEEVMEILDESSQAIAHSRELERKSRALEAATVKLRAANRRLQELDRLKDDFVSMVSHELRTPLTSMRAFAEILLDNPELEAADRERFLGIIVGEIERLTRLINQVLDLSKIESGRAEWHLSEIDLRQIIEEGLASTAQLFRDRGAEVDARLPEDGVPRVRADRDRVMQVVLNLLSNAAKFCADERGLVSVTLQAENGALRVDVADNGRGIREENQEVIFDKFRQGGEDLTERPQGSGLGLPISRQIISHLGGELWVRSTPGEGATFSFTLPLVSAGVPAEAVRR
jgi:Na+/proline symporter/nitrogen-specific signal transduction histidine kinase